MEFPADESLPDLPRLFDGDWVWQMFRGEFGEQGPAPEVIRIAGVSHSRGREVVVSYEIEWPPDAYLPNDRFTLQLACGRDLRMSRFPDDAYLPGLGEASGPESALRLVSKYVMAIPPRRMRVQVIRYRPRSHAVLRHRMGKSSLYARVVRPSAVASILESGELIERSEFTVPRLAGLWREGGVLWFSDMPGRNLRGQLRKGDTPPPGLILDGLESLWTIPLNETDNPPFNLPGAYHRAKQILEHSLPNDDEGRQEYGDTVEVLDPFAESWRPSAVAHNDFYDDQMVVLPDGRLALVDLEGAGPGDPMLDVGNFLAHLNWSSRVSRRGDAFGEYHHAFRREALERFGWTEADLNLREAVCLFRICTNAVRHPQDDWKERLAAGLSIVGQVIS